MIKHINHQNFMTTPFVVAKSWNLYNVQNENSILTDIPSSLEVPIASDYIDYHTGNPFLNRECDIVLEQQTTDIAFYEEGITGSGAFNPDTDKKNSDLTYKRLVHNQIRTSFYNKYNNPTEMFGVEVFDFPLSKTDRYLSDFFRMFSIPQKIFGEKIIPKSVIFYDTSLDDNVNITDDGFQNLIAGNNLFSKIQEIRSLGNVISEGNVINFCPSYDNPADIPIHPVTTSFDTASLSLVFSNGFLENAPPLTDSASIYLNFYTGSLKTVSISVDITGSLKEDISTYFIGFNTGSLINTVISSYITGSLSEDISTYFIGFNTGSLINLVFLASASVDSSSFTIGFNTGSCPITTTVVTMSANQMTNTIGFYQGSLV